MILELVVEVRETAAIPLYEVESLSSKTGLDYASQKSLSLSKACKVPYVGVRYLSLWG